MPTKFILFDCWGTLFTNSTPYLPRLADRLNESMGNYHFVKILEETIMLGDEDLDASFAELVRRVKGRDDPELAKELKRMFLDSQHHQQPFPETAEVLALLKEKYRLGMITNSSKLTLENLRKNSPLLKDFAFILASYETGLLKPDPEVFRLALRKADVQAEEAVMVGDNIRDDCEAAESCGIRSVLIDRSGRYPHITHKITDLRELFSHL